MHGFELVAQFACRVDQFAELSNRLVEALVERSAFGVEPAGDRGDSGPDLVATLESRLDRLLPALNAVKVAACLLRTQQFYPDAVGLIQGGLTADEEQVFGPAAIAVGLIDERPGPIHGTGIGRCGELFNLLAHLDRPGNTLRKLGSFFNRMVEVAIEHSEKTALNSFESLGGFPALVQDFARLGQLRPRDFPLFRQRCPQGLLGRLALKTRFTTGTGARIMA